MTDVMRRLTAALADRYRIERELGAGGMATVYLAEDIKHKRHVALKVLKPELAAVLGAERFVQEITTTAALQHPHILPLFDSGTAEGFLFYVMPFIDGETLRGKLDRETQLGVDEAVRIATDVADALHYAHAHGVIHRDIKPENILLANGRPMVADFGIALAVSAAAGGRMTETGLSLGTPHYMSPEQATAEKEITARSDVYSLGSVLYEMLAGSPPHVGSTAQQIIMKIITEQPQQVTALRKTVPRNVAAAIARSLEKLPADRFATAAAFGAALKDPAFGASDAQFTALAAAPTGFRRLITPALAAVSVVATVAAIWGWARSMPAGPIAAYSMRLPAGQEVNQGTNVIGGRVALSPDGEWIAYTGNAEGVLLGPAIVVRRRSELSGSELAGTVGARRLFFSPDSRSIGFFGADGSLSVVGTTGTPARRVGTSRFYELGGGVWGEDGFLYASAAGGQVGLVRTRPDGSGLDTITRVDTASGERSHLYPSLLPNGRGVLLTVRGLREGDRIDLLDLRTRERRQLASGVAAWYASSGHLVYATIEGALMAVAFDVGSMAISGFPVPMREGIGVTRLGAEVALSSTGTLAYLSGATGIAAQPVIVDERGGATPVDRDWTILATSLYSTMTLSPDGGRLAVSHGATGEQAIWVKQMPRGPSTQLTFEGRINARASWASDSRTLYFVSDRSGRNDLWRQVADGTRPAELTTATDANEGFVSADGNWLVHRGASPERHIFARRIRGDTAERIVVRSDRGEDLAPALSPDGRLLAYTGSESVRNEIYLRPFPEVDLRKVQVSAAGGLEPRWSRDGRTLFYRSDANELMTVSVERRGAEIVVGTPRALFSMNAYLPPNPYQQTYDVLPDGKRFVMARRIESAGDNSGEQLIVVDNWFEELKSKVPR